MPLEGAITPQQETRNEIQEINKLEADLGESVQSLTETDRRIVEALNGETESNKLRSITEAYEKARGRINAAAAGAGLLAASETLIGLSGHSPAVFVTGLVIGGNLAAAMWMVGHGLNSAKTRAQEFLSRPRTKH